MLDAKRFSEIEAEFSRVFSRGSRLSHSFTTEIKELIVPSFDIVSEFDMQELTNAVDQANRELTSRFDFKGTKACFEQEKNQITLVAEADFQLSQLKDILESKLIKRGIDIRCIESETAQIAIHQARQKVTVKEGIESALAKKIAQLIKDSKIKVQASIQGEKVRVTGKKRDDLQQVIALLKESKIEMPLQFDNFRD